MMMRGLVIILLIVELSTSIPYLGDAQANCVGSECYCEPSCEIKYSYTTVNGECVRICICDCLSPPPPFRNNPLQAPPPATKSNPQPQQPPTMTKPNPSVEAPPPSFQPKPLQAPPPTTKSNPQQQQPPTMTKPNPSIEAPQAPPKTPVVTPIAYPFSYCEIPVYAPYFVKRGKYCWCNMEGYYNGCFEKIWRAATTNYDYAEVDKNCCDAFWVAYDTCGMIDGQYRYYVSQLKQHCYQFYSD